jgi:hypothetical protein
MKLKIFLSISLFILICSAFAQNRTSVNPYPRYRIFLNTLEGRSIEGLLIKLEDSTVTVFPGSRKEWRKNINENPVKINYSQIQQIKLKRKNGLVRGMLIGMGAGLLPLVGGSVIGPNAAYTGAFISLLTVPIGFITGGIMGATASVTSKKGYYIRGRLSKFYDFKKRIKKV